MPLVPSSFESQVEEGRYRGPDFPTPEIRGGNVQDDSRLGRQHSMRLGVPVTGNLLFTTSVVVGFGIPEAIFSYHGHSLTTPTLDWVGGTISAILLLWLKVIEDKSPELCPLFFKVDLAPYILEILRRDDVYFWFASVLPLVRAVEGILFMVHTRRQLLKYVTSDSLMVQCLVEGMLSYKYNVTLPSATIRIVLGFSMTVFLFCLHGLNVLCPTCLQGNGRYALLIFNIMIVAHLLYLCIEASRIEAIYTSGSMCLMEEIEGLELDILPNYTQVMIATTTRIYMFMIPLALPLVSTGSKCSRLIWCACTVILELAFYILEVTPETRTLLFLWL